MKKTAVVTAAMDAPLFGNRTQACVGVVIRRVLSISLVMGVIMALAGNVAWGEAGVSLVMNGSFENDGEINPITAEDVPQYWCDVNIPTDKFGGKVDTIWSTHHYGDGDGNCLTLYSIYNVKCNEGDMAMVSQQVYLADVNLIFDLKLSSSKGQWDPSKRSAVILIDDYKVWDSNSLGSSIGDATYLNVEVPLDINDTNLRKLSLAIRSNVTEAESPREEYRTRWDFVKFDAHCGGFGYLWEDLNQDCNVNMLDLEMLAGQWLAEDPNEEYDLYQDDIVDFHDFAFFAEYWMCNTLWQNWQDNNCFEMELLAGDLNNDGIVNLRDFAILTGDWMKEGNCIRGDIDRSEIVDYNDFSRLVDEWLQISWLSRL